ncbi:hypothetical protein [Vibrio methylphosphonaticus]|uniref:hypothetical protein n=1 Tax=Vibrio methylphosphonaticus TaxID=2946866 RepID=UPI002029CDA5|nr:hypothetical protein [Vibrio methylphosphonaticus]MCL9776264.1 hypothetical protein [Vibrio methylphosphonaticus]
MFRARKVKLTLVLLCLALGALLPLAGLANENDDSGQVGTWTESLMLTVDYQLNVQSVGDQNSAFFPETNNESVQTVNGLVDIGVGFKAFFANLALQGSDLFNDAEPSSSGYRDREFDAIIREAVYETQLSFGDAELDVLFGKARIDWGVGYGYRVLDVFNPYRRNPVGIQIEEGAGTLALSHYGVSSEWTLIATDSSWTQLAGSDFDEANQQQGVGARYYTLHGDSEIQAVGYYDNVRQGLIGGSFVTVFGESWEFHSSAMMQRRYLNYQFEDAAPAELKENHNAVQYLMGVTWANETGHSVIAEYWYDERAWSEQTWTSAYDSATQVNPLAAYSYGLGYTQKNLVQHNIMLHWSLDPAAWSRWDWSRQLGLTDRLTPKIDLMISPEDGGVIATQWLDYLIMDTGDSNLHIELAARYVTGGNKSAYANLPDRYNMLINIKGRF